MTRENGNREPSPLKRRWLLNAGLIVFVALLAAIVAYTQFMGPKKAEVSLTNLRADDVTRIELAHTGRSKIVLTRTETSDKGIAQDWRMAEPVTARVNPFNVQALLDLMAVPATELPYAPERLAAYGLDKPATEVRYNDRLVAFGGTHPFQQQVYAKYGGRIFLVGAQPYRVATYAYSSFIDTRLLEPDRALSAIELPDFQLERKNGAWQRKPERPALSADRIAHFVEQWRHARALTVERAKGGRPIKRVTLRFEGGTPLVIDVMAEQPELVLRRTDEELAYHFPAAVAVQLLTLAPDKKN